jgi:hypothetical protein
MQKSGKDHSLLLVLPSGIYRYRFVVDGERRCLPDLPCETDSMGNAVNLLDVNVSSLSYWAKLSTMFSAILPLLEKYNVFLVQCMSYNSVVQESG